MAEAIYPYFGGTGSQPNLRRGNLRTVPSSTADTAIGSEGILFISDVSEGGPKKIEVPRKESTSSSAKFGRRKEDARTKMAESDYATRELIDAKLQAAEARTETRITQLSGSLDLKVNHLENKIDQLVTAVNASTASFHDVKKDNTFTRWTIIAIVIAGAAAMYAAQANYIASFAAGISAFQVKSDQAKVEPIKSEPTN